MKRLSIALLAVVAIGVSASQVHAQRGGGMGMMGGSAAVLGNPDVHKELKLTDEQISKAQAIVEQMREGMRERFQSLQGLSPEEMREAGQKMMKEINDELHGKVKEFFQPEQLARFEQLEIQAQGFQAFVSEKVVKALKITEEQKAKFQGIIDDVQSEMRSAFQDAAGDREAMMAKMTEIRKSAMDKAKALLSEEQVKAWGELIGKPFEFRMQRRRDA
jgi:Spy/CpxP family protein refolding chaperone